MFIFNTRSKLLLSVIFILAATQIFAADGDPDLTFGGDGKVITDVNSGNDTVRDIVVQTDGKIIAVGFSISGLPSLNRGAVVRHRPNGSVDTTFGTNGRVVIPSVLLEEAALSADGKIVVAGYAGTSPNYDFYVARLNPDGTFDTTFNGTGALTLDLRSLSDVASSVIIQPDGKILVGGASSIDFAIVRLNVDGSLDTSFDGDGKTYTTIQQNGGIRHLALQPDGKILAAGASVMTDTSSGNPFSSFTTARYNANGSLDTSFNGNGFALTMFVSNGSPGGTRSNTAEAVLLRPDGKILVVGTTSSCCGPQPLSQVAMIQYNPDGTVDSGFGTDGKRQTSFGGSAITTANDAALQTDNKIVVTGSSGNVQVSNVTVGRFTADGLPDPSFNDDGWNTIQFPSGVFGNAYATAIQPDGKILIGGYRFGSGGPQDFLLARFNAFCTTTCAGGRYEIADFDGDGRTDLSVFRSGTWFINPSTANNPTSYYSQSFGAAGDWLVPEDYDGDSRTDIAVWREDSTTNQSYFHILQSATNTLRSYQFGNTGDDPGAVGDWDGDGKADLAIYRPGAQSLFYFIPSSAPTNFTVIPWGIAEDKVVRGDYDGDNRQDAAVYRPSNGVWYVMQSANLQPFYLQWGLATDKIIPADYDGDGKTDPAIYRDGVWYVWQSSNQQPRYQYWGISGDQVVAGDYDGDGRVDFAVRRGGVYYILQNSNSQPFYYQFGFADDIPAASAFVR